MRLILVDSENELVRCDFELPDFDGGRLSIPDLSKLAAAHVEANQAEPEHYELRSYRPYEDVGGYFVFIAKERSPASPTTLTEVIGVCDCIGYVRRTTSAESASDLQTPSAVVHGNHARQEATGSFRIY